MPTQAAPQSDQDPTTRLLSLIPEEDRESWMVLWAPFPREVIGHIPQRDMQIPFIRAPILMARLDDAVGPGCWEDRYEVLGSLVVCSLTLEFPSGKIVTKRDAGAKPTASGGMEGGDGEKAGFTAGFKRAAKKFGIGRYLDNKNGAWTMPELAVFWHGPDSYLPSDNRSPQAAPKSNQGRSNNSAPIVANGTPSHVEAGSHAPRTANEVYPWARKYSLIKPLEEFARRCGWSTKFKEWDGEMIQQAVAAVLAKNPDPAFQGGGR